MSNWKALIDIDGAPANGRFRENEMIFVTSGKRAYIWNHLEDSRPGNPVPRTWIRVYVGASMSEKSFEDWDAATACACELLKIAYAKTPPFPVALAAARAQLAIEKAEKAKIKPKARASAQDLHEQLRGETGPARGETLIVGSDSDN